MQGWKRTLRDTQKLPTRVMLAEDDAAMRAMIADGFLEDGYDVLEVEDGLVFLECLKEIAQCHLRTPDVVVMDVRMPGHSGLALLDTLRDAGWDMPVIIVTAFGDAAVHARARELGATAVFDKPFDIDDLRTAVMNVVKVRDCDA